MALSGTSLQSRSFVERCRKVPASGCGFPLHYVGSSTRYQSYVAAPSGQPSSSRYQPPRSSWTLPEKFIRFFRSKILHSPIGTKSNEVLSFQDKRSKFARFYFLGDEDLLDIIGQASSKPSIIQSHLKKLFAGIHSVVFSANGRQISAVSSLEGEQVALKSPITVDGEVETWLNKLVVEAQSTLKVLLLEAVQQRQKNPPKLDDFPSQILCLAEAIVFTERCEKAIASNSLTSLLSDYKNQLVSYTSHQDDMDGVGLLKLQSLIMDVIHYIDIVDQLMKNQCWSLDDWIWQKQLR